MKKHIIKETIWVISLVSLALLCKFVYVVFLAPASIEPGWHTRVIRYDAFAGAGDIYLLLPALFFIAFLIRAVINRFKNSYLLYVLAISCFVIIITLKYSEQLALEYSRLQLLEQIALLQQSNAQKDAPVTGLFYGGDGYISSGTSTIKTVLFGIELLFTIFIGIIGYLIGKNRKRPPERSAAANL
ncbi:hypothetical protein [Mucilaginibacter sp.]|uniref:hypothetical protein n=1 Tax=Mucilaginibacter sp. TaxID=1882438 RepID=UPI0032647B91